MQATTKQDDLLSATQIEAAAAETPELKKTIGKLKKQLCVHKAKDKKVSSVSSSHTMDGRDLMELDGAILQEVNYLNSIETGGKRLLLR